MQRIKSDIQRIQKLINIAKPIELPPLNFEPATMNATQSEKNLPLFGKKKSFGFEKLKSQITPKQDSSSASLLSNENKTKATDTVEEFDDDDNDGETSTSHARTSKISKSNTETIPRPEESKKSINDDTLNKNQIIELESIKRLRKESNTSETPSSMKQKEKRKEEKKIYEHNESLHSNEQNDSNSSSSLSMTIASNVANDRKSRNRHRNKARHHIDIDDTEENTSPQKFSSWMPPENQTGDGMTELNSKYGY